MRAVTSFGFESALKDQRIMSTEVSLIAHNLCSDILGGIAYVGRQLGVFFMMIDKS